MRHALKIFLIVLCLAGPAWAQPDRRGEEVTTTPEYHGIRANAPIPYEFHVRNEGGSDGAGLCVISSLLINGAYQGVPDLAGLKDSELWKAAKAAPGGYYPEKLEALLKRIMPDEKWFSWEGEGTDLLEEYSAQGYPVAATMNTGALYNYIPIHHMISVIHLDGHWACVLDNNDPGKYHWMPRSEYDRRYIDGAKGWGVVWLRKPFRGVVKIRATVALFLASGAVLLAAKRLESRSWPPQS